MSPYTEKITGQYLLERSAAQPGTLFIFGSSELRTTEIPTHPANFSPSSIFLCWRMKPSPWRSRHR